ncbi:hypothetical protein PTTG_27614 [Puccinia triticina 1-1 BBBD Race 1]|uniref:Putative tyrosine-protein phosphatase OCA1 n=1 Tax=Puccinia triticina (isolate 1-1 / race 1 (BBBD)) TaxID=630390 RepID=A0A180GJF1_PUCT1|nr:hypothetical protein PTTG_27614 [Puccinia triticina 1-1 BBBD Race 1]
MNRRNSSRENSTCSSATSAERPHPQPTPPATISRSSSFTQPAPPPPQTQQHPQTPPPQTTPTEHPEQQQSLFDPLPHLPSRLRQATLKLVPPPNFGFIEGSLFRAGEPAELSLNFIQRLGLHSLLWLAPHPPQPPVEFLLLHSINFHDLGIQHAASLDAVTEEAVTHALQLILNPSIYPLMIMCGGGSHRTGTVVGCLRKLQGWNLASIFEEYRRYAGAQHHIMNEQFIEFYNVTRLAHRLTLDEPSHTHHQAALNHPHPQQASSPRLPTPSPPDPPNHPRQQIYKIATPSGLHLQN